MKTLLMRIFFAPKKQSNQLFAILMDSVITSEVEDAIFKSMEKLKIENEEKYFYIAELLSDAGYTEKEIFKALKQ
jgi:hypothetical protein